LLKSAKLRTNDELLALRKATLIRYKKYQLKRLEEVKKHKELLDSFLLEANKYQIPTKEHEGIKNFMVQQLTETIRFDADTDYSDNRLLGIETELFNLSADKIRKEMIDKAEHDFAYHTTEQNKELKRCHESNEWVRRYFESIGIV